MTTIKIEGLYKAAYAAYGNISFSPEKRAEQIVLECEDQLNEDVNGMPEEEKERYVQGHNKHLFAWLAAMSRCASTMITGGSNFPVAQNRKRMDIERKRGEEFMEWRKRALEAIAKKIESAKPKEQKDSERWQSIKNGLESSMKTITEIDNGTNRYSSRPLSVSSISGVIKTLAKHGDLEMVERSLNLIRNWNNTLNKPAIGGKHSIWGLAEIAEKIKSSMESACESENTETEINGVRMLANNQADRLQLFFKGKPECDIINQLKHSAFKWSPSNGCWQRKLTQNAIYAAKTILKTLK